jgi:O-antigen/teichoic acid export membrane protein
MSYKADSIFKNHFFNLSIQILNIIFPLIAIPYTTRLFGPDILGEVNFANSIVQYFMLIASAGIPIYAVREIAKSRDNNNLLKIKFFELSLIQGIFTLISTIIYIILIFSVSSIRVNSFIYLFLGIQIISNAFNFTWFIQGIEKYRYVAIATFASRLINVILIFTMLNSKLDYITYAFIIGITTLINNLINLLVAVKLSKHFKSDNKISINTENLKVHIQAAMIFFLSDVAVKVYTAMDQTMLGIFSNSEAVGYYSMSIRLVKSLLTIVTSVAVVMLPRISNSIKNNKIKEIKQYVGLSIKLVYIIAIPAIFGMIAIGKEIITIYLGPEFLNSIFIFKLISVLLIIIGLANVFGTQVMIPYGKEKKYTMILAIAAIVNFLLNLILIKKYSYIGASIATIIAEFIIAYLSYREAKKLIGNIPEIFQFWKYLIPSIVFYVIIKFVIKAYVISDISVILISIPVASLIYGIGLIIQKEELTSYFISKLTKGIKSKLK